MATTIFPQNGDDGSEQAFQDHALASVMSHVKKGLEVTIDSGLDVSISAGEAVVGGVRVDTSTPPTITVPDDDVSYVYLKLTRASGLVQSPATDADNFTAETATVEDKDHLLLAVVNASSGSITQVDDVRWRSPGETMSAGNSGTKTFTGTTHSVLDDVQVPVNVLVPL